MYTKLSPQERLKDLRVVDKHLTLEQLEAQTGLSKAALGNYERKEQDISAFAIATLAKFYGVSTDYLMGLTESHDHPLSGWHVLPLEGDITCLRPEGALKSANCTTFTAAPKLGAFSVLPYSGVASKEACWFALTSYFRSKRDLLIVFLHRLTRERVDILY